MSPTISIFFAFLTTAATLLGAAVLLWKNDWARKHSQLLISFAAGALLGLVFFDLLPEIIELNERSLGVALAAFLFFYFGESVLLIRGKNNESVWKLQGNGYIHEHPLNWLALSGIGFHSFIEGIAIALGFEISLELGLATTLSVFLHELPEGITLTSILMHHGTGKMKALLEVAVVALATPLATLLTIIFAKDFSSSWLGILLAIAAGSFLYLSAVILIPETQKTSSWQNVLVLVLGVLVVFFVA
jgi:zinc and cadmium transporter